MKRLINLSAHRLSSIIFLVLIILTVSFSGITAQEKQAVTGKLIDIKSNLFVPYANVALIKASDNNPVSGSISDENGVFTIRSVPMGNFRLYISVIGYKPVIQDLVITGTDILDAGIIFLQDTAIIIKETIIVGERVKAKSETGKTTFFVTKKMLDASLTGTDILKLIPGVQIDLMQNISVEGNRSIRILVDGKERDGSFISQINPGQIDKVEIISKPITTLDGDITGAINIILKKERNSGISGQVYAEIPTSGSQMLLGPAYSLDYGYNKLNLYTSYKGELTYLDIHEKTVRKQYGNRDLEINSNQYVNQKNWSHRFNYGFDYFLNTHNQINFYAFYNPFSRELDGNADLQTSDAPGSYWKAKKEDTDRNESSFYSLYYKHDFEREGSSLTYEISNYNMKGENSTEYIPVENDHVKVKRVNAVKPKKNEVSIKIDYVSSISKKVDFGTGVKARYRLLQDRNIHDFAYTEEIFAAYGTIGYKQAKYDINMGGRIEKTFSMLENNFNNTDLHFFPQINLKHIITSRQNIQLSYSHSIVRPDIYQLNPYISIDDPYTVRKGNPFLNSELHRSLFLEHSVQFKGNYLTSRLFYKNVSDAMDNLTFINDSNAFESQVNNLGNMQQYGLQLLGSLKLGIITFNPYFKIFCLYTNGNALAKQHNITDRHNLAFDGGLSTIISFRHELSLSMVFQYASPNNTIQGNSFSSALYFLSLEKTFKQRIKVGFVSAIPFTKSFTYQGSEINGTDFYSKYEGNVNVKHPFCWFKLSYQFTSGKNRDHINRATEEINNIPKKGF